MIIALDVGRKRVGVASSTSAQLATPVGVWDLHPQKDFMRRLQELDAAQKIEVVVIGKPGDIPKNYSNIGVDLAYAVGRKIGRTMHVKVEYVDESFSTKEARAQTEAPPGDHADAQAAKLILERYLTEKKSPAGTGG